MDNPYVQQPQDSGRTFEPTPHLPPDPSSSGRPAGVLVFAILCFVFAVGGAFGFLNTLATLFASGEAAANNPAIQIYRTNDMLYYFSLIGTCIGIVFVLVQVTAGIALLKMSPIGRTLILIYAYYTIVMALVSGIVNYVYMMPALKEQLETQPGNFPPEAQAIVEVMMHVGVLGGMLFGMLFPAAILWYFNSGRIKDLFAANS